MKKSPCIVSEQTFLNKGQHLRFNGQNVKDSWTADTGDYKYVQQIKTQTEEFFKWIHQASINWMESNRIDHIEHVNLDL